jgi:hypothetical protein
MLNTIFNKIKIVYLSIQNKLPIILGKIFTKSNINKILIIFIVGFVFRIFIYYMYNINIFSYYLYQNLGRYYFIFAWISLIIHEFLNYFYITMDISPSSKPIPKLKSNTIFKMEPSREITPKVFNPKGPRDGYTYVYSRRELSEIWDDTSFKNKFISNCKKEFNEFCSIYKGSIKLRANELGKLNDKLADAYYKGVSDDEALNILPNEIKPLYKEFLEKRK